MQSVIQIRLFEEEFKDAVATLILPIQREEFGIDITLDKQPDLSDIASFYQQGKGNFWVAVNGDDVVGTISLKDIGNDNCALRKMFVHKDFRGSQFGAARSLLKTALQWAKEKDVKSIYLGTTPKFLAAHRFYEKNEFEEISEDALPSGFPLMSVDKKFYRYSL